MVNANVGGNDLGSFVKEVKQKIASQVHLPPGYTLAYGGEYTSLQEGRSRLTLVIPIALAAILSLLLIVFGKMRQALMIFSGIPLAVSGGILALTLRGLPLSMTTAVGFIALGGIALLNGIVMLSFINDLRKKGKSVKEAVEEGAQGAPAARPDDRHRRHHRVHPDGALHRHGRRGAAPARHGGHRRPPHGDLPDPVRPAHPLRLV